MSTASHLLASPSGPIGWVAAVLVWVFVTWSHLGLGRGFVPNPLDALAVIAAAWLAVTKEEGWAFTAACLAIASAVGSIFFDLYPHVMVSTTNAAYNLTVANTASPSYTLKVMTVVALIFFPVVLLYQGWTFYVFRNRLHSPTDGASKTAPGGGETVVAVHTSEGEDG